MPRHAVSEDLKARIPALHYDGYSIKQICDTLAVKKSLVRKTLALFSEQNRLITLNPHKHAHIGGRPRVRKVVTAPALERNVILRAQYMNRIGAEARDANMLMFLDESAKDGRTSFYKSGKGKWCIQRQRFVRDTCYSVLPALTLDGIIAYDIIEGSVTGDRFVQFLKDYVMPFTTPYPGPRSVLVMDKSTIHRGEEVRKLVEDNLCKLIYLPPHPPSYNPIEEAFSTIKSYLHHDFTDGTVMPIVRACQAITPDQAAGYFRAAGYIA